MSLSCALFGARPLKRAIQRHLQDPLAMALLEGRFSLGTTVNVDREGDALSFTAAVSAPSKIAGTK